MATITDDRHHWWINEWTVVCLSYISDLDHIRWKVNEWQKWLIALCRCFCNLRLFFFCRNYFNIVLEDFFFIMLLLLLYPDTELIFWQVTDISIDVGTDFFSHFYHRMKKMFPFPFTIYFTFIYSVKIIIYCLKVFIFHHTIFVFFFVIFIMLL